MRVERKNIAISGRDPIVTMPFVSADPNILVSDASVAGQPLIIERL
ncbi:hypothetical protein KA037_02015 [Patescibacteria group bacterium]|nr:hypothetical protein [Patescibacteria group bacterium]MBP7841437.1 hypothetical protein [Patescibacteria group bacterium]